jgi:hypothetical protein
VYAFGHDNLRHFILRLTASRDDLMLLRHAAEQRREASKLRLSAATHILDVGRRCVAGTISAHHGLSERRPCLQQHSRSTGEAREATSSRQP